MNGQLWHRIFVYKHGAPMRMYSQLKLHSVIRFFTIEKCTVPEIHESLVRVYREGCMMLYHEAVDWATAHQHSNMCSRGPFVGGRSSYGNYGVVVTFAIARLQQCFSRPLRTRYFQFSKNILTLDTTFDHIYLHGLIIVGHQLLKKCAFG